MEGISRSHSTQIWKQQEEIKNQESHILDAKADPESTAATNPDATTNKKSRPITTIQKPDSITKNKE